MTVRNRRKEPKYKFSSEHYRRRLDDLEKIGTVKKNHSPSTKNNINEVSERWQKYCECIAGDKLKLLKGATKRVIMGFLEWNLDNYRSRKSISVHQKFKHWRQLYRRHTGRNWNDKWRVEVNDYIKGELSAKYKLDMSTDAKPVMNVDDVFLVLHHHWAKDTSTFADERQRVQLWLLILICAYTGSRPGALVHVRRNTEVLSSDALDGKQSPGNSIEHGKGGIGNTDEWRRIKDGGGEVGQQTESGTELDSNEVIETLCYKHVTLILIPKRDDVRDMLAMEIDLRFVKGHKRNFKRKMYCLYEVDDLIFDPVLCMLVLGVLDNAFQLENRSVGDLLGVRVDKHRHSSRLRWKKEWEDRPIFRQAIQTSDGFQTSSKQPLSYQTFLRYLKRLGFMAGMMQILKPYNIRRGTGEAVDAVATQAQLQQVMGHRDAGVFQAYLNERVSCDVQAAFLGRPSADALLKSVGHMNRDVDPRAPTRLTDLEIDGLTTHPTLVQLRQRRDALREEGRRLYGTLKRAQAAGAEIYALHREACLDFESAKKGLERQRLTEARANFFDRIETEDALHQLESASVDDNINMELDIVEHELAERKKVVKLLCGRQSDLGGQDKLGLRIDAAEALLSLCRTKQTVLQRRGRRNRDWGILPSPDSSRDSSPVSGPRDSPIKANNRQCIFCLCKNQMADEFSRPRKAREHVERQHLRWFKQDDLIPCPDEYCRRSGVILYGHQHFKNHVAKMHGSSLLPYTLS